MYTATRNTAAFDTWHNENFRTEQPAPKTSKPWGVWVAAAIVVVTAFAIPAIQVFG